MSCEGRPSACQTQERTWPPARGRARCEEGCGEAQRARVAQQLMQRFCVLALLGLSLCAARPSDRLPMLAKRRIDASAGFSEVPLEPLDEWVANHEVRPRLNPRRGAGLKSQQTLLAARAPYVVKGRSLAYRRAIIATIWCVPARLASCTRCGAEVVTLPWRRAGRSSRPSRSGLGSCCR